MPTEPSDIDIYDTSAEYLQEWVSYGEAIDPYFKVLSDDTKVRFDNNVLTTYTEIYEVNLIKCQYLNLSQSYVTKFDA